ncbi:MAG: hypothetical protein EOO91_10955 [Pedobacter sp.]|nr:MAG: hypothetical protein EOO91_10955 [Pedobacter sp.]
MKAKLYLSLLFILSLIFTVLASARLERRSFHRTTSIDYSINKDRNRIPDNSSVILSSDGSCAGSELTVNSSKPVSSIVWMLDEVSILEQSNSKQNNGLVVAGGNGTGNAANQLFNPNRLFVDKEGNLYIPDMANNRIQKWAPGATSGTTIAGGNGAGNAANQFNRPTSVTVDINGNIYVADQNNSRVQKWVPGASSGTTIATALNTPTGVFIDNLGNLYVSEQNAQCVRKFAGTTGVGVIVAGGNGYGSSANQLASPTGIFVDNNGNLYVCDTDNSRVQKWALGSNSGTTVARISGNPLGVYVDGSNNIYVTDYTGFNVQKFIPGSINGVIIAGGNGQGNNPNQITPAGVWMDKSNNLYVSDFLNGRIIKFGNVYTGTYATNKGGTYTAKITTIDGEVLTSNPIVIKDNLTPKIIIQSNTNLVCNQFIPVFTASIENGGSTPVIQWKINNNNVSNANSLTFTPASLSDGDKVSCDLTNSEGCVTTALVHSNVIGVISGTEMPTISITSDVSNICKGNKITFTATSTNSGLFPSYIWKVNNNSIAGNGSTFESSTLNNGDEVKCEVISNAQYCQASTSATSNVIVANVNPILTPTIFISQDQMHLVQMMMELTIFGL